MATFILCMSYRGPRPDLTEDPDERNSEPMRALAAARGKLVGLYRTQGRFDVIAIVEMPDAESVHSFNLAMQDEHFTVETLRAFTPEEFPGIWSNAGRIAREAATA